MAWSCCSNLGKNRVFALITPVRNIFKMWKRAQGGLCFCWAAPAEPRHAMGFALGSLSEGPAGRGAFLPVFLSASRDGFLPRRATSDRAPSSPPDRFGLCRVLLLAAGHRGCDQQQQLAAVSPQEQINSNKPWQQRRRRGEPLGLIRLPGALLAVALSCGWWKRSVWSLVCFFVWVKWNQELDARKGQCCKGYEIFSGCVVLT